MGQKKIIINTNTITTKEYAQVLLNIKNQVKKTQIKAALSANKELILLYWSIGKTIAEKQKDNKWGTNIIEQLAKDLQNTFPDMTGFSQRNVFRMQAFFLAYEKVPQAVAEIADLPIFRIPWGHNAVLLEKIKTNNQRIWYAQKTIENGWSRSMLETWIKADLFNRKGKAITNFNDTLPSPQSDLAQQTLKDPYLFEFLTLQEEHKERDLEIGLLLCKSKKKLTVEYALRRSSSPIGVASYETQIMADLPKDLKGNLPTVKEIESELEKQAIIKDITKHENT